MNKQIEEMAKDIYEQKSCDTSFEENCKLLAYDLVTLGYQKVEEDSVVLSREEYNLIDHNIKHLETVCNNLEKERDRLYEMKLDLENQLIEKGWTDYEGADEIEKRVRKETAREILQWLKDHCAFAGWVLVETYFREQFGVEVDNN